MNLDKVITGTLVILMLYLLASCNSKQYSLVPTVKGKVVSAFDKKPVAAAKIYVHKNAFNAFDTILTDSEGLFTVPGFTVSDYKDIKYQQDINDEFFIEKEGYEKYSVHVKKSKAIKDTVDLGSVQLNPLPVAQKDIYINKVFHSGDELNDIEFVKTGKTKVDSLSYSIYKVIYSGKYIFALERLLKHEDVEQYRVMDTVHLNSPDVQLLYKFPKDHIVLELLHNGQILKNWSFKHEHNETGL